MGLREDLMAAAGLAAADAATEGASPVDRERGARLAKVALEAAALVEDIRPGEIRELLDVVARELVDAGVIGVEVTLLDITPAELLAELVAAMKAWRTEVVNLGNYARAFERLHDLAAGLERDFIAGATDTSLRIASRIHTVIEEVEGIVPAVVTSEGDGAGG